MSKELFAGVSLDGAAMSTDEDANSSYRGVNQNMRTILEKRASKSSVKPLLIALNNLIRQLGRKQI